MRQLKARLKDTAAYDAYVRLRFPAVAQQMRRETDFYCSVLRRSGSDLVFDIGANNGGPAAIFSKLASKVVCVEPNPQAAQSLRQRFRRRRNVEIVQTAVGDRIGSAEMTLYADSDAYSTLSEKWVGALADGSSNRPIIESGTAITVPITTLDQLVSVHGRPDYIKIDVEGFELPVIRGLTEQVPMISFECNQPSFTDDAISIIEALSNTPNAVFNYFKLVEPYRWASDGWLEARDMKRIVTGPPVHSMEIFCARRPR
jgi:FkbM family methyltransferase